MTVPQQPPERSFHGRPRVFPAQFQRSSRIPVAVLKDNLQKLCTPPPPPWPMLPTAEQRGPPVVGPVLHTSRTSWSRQTAQMAPRGRTVEPGPAVARFPLRPCHRKSVAEVAAVCMGSRLHRLSQSLLQNVGYGCECSRAWNRAHRTGQPRTLGQHQPSNQNPQPLLPTWPFPSPRPPNHRQVSRRDGPRFSRPQMPIATPH